MSSMEIRNRCRFIGIKILINASQVTNPSIDPLREPMETKTFLGKKPNKIERDADGKIIDNLPPQLELSMPVMFSAMSYGSISYNAHESLARAAQELGIFIIPARAACIRTFISTEPIPLFRWLRDVSVCIRIIWKPVFAVEIKMGQGAKPGIGGHLPGAKIVGDVSRPE